MWTATTENVLLYGHTQEQIYSTGITLLYVQIAFQVMEGTQLYRLHYNSMDIFTYYYIQIQI